MFLILYYLPGDTAVLIAGQDASPETITQIREKLGTDKPLWFQYTTYLAHLARADLGTSTNTGELVAERLKAQVPATLQLTFLSCAVAIITGVSIGVTAAVHNGRWIDHIIQTSLLFFMSMPSFWFGFLLILIFSVKLKWLPAIGNGSLAQLILPTLCLGLVTSAKLARMVRNSVIDVLGEAFVIVLRGKGLLENQVIYKHVLRNALIPVVTLFGILVGELLANSIVIETLFARQGLGRLLVEAVSVKDIPMVLGVTLLVSVIYIFINFIIDISYTRLDPRIQP